MKIDKNGHNNYSTVHIKKQKPQKIAFNLMTCSCSGSFSFCVMMSTVWMNECTNIYG